MVTAWWRRTVVVDMMDDATGETTVGEEEDITMDIDRV
jgi:hypothetical protein